MSASSRTVRALQIGLVSAYLALAAAWLLLTRRVPGGAFRRVMRARLRPPYESRLTSFQPDDGLGWIASVPAQLLSDLESSSSLVMFEDGEPLGPPHSAHTDVRLLGGGRFSHWGARLYFSTSDGSDPRNNGRCYEVREARR
jgi:hypothetical protein